MPENHTHDALPETFGDGFAGAQVAGQETQVQIQITAEVRSMASSLEMGNPLSQGWSLTPGQFGPWMRREMKREALARSAWHAQRIAKEAPYWFGLPWDNSAEDAEMPQRFGIMVETAATVPAGTRADPAAEVHPEAGTQNGVQEVAGAGLLAFPAGHDKHAPRFLRRPRETVLPFRAPAGKQAIGIFSLAGGVGGTSLAAGLARVLANCGERVLVADAAPGHTLLPRYFGGDGSQHGKVRRFIPLPESNNEIVSMLSLDVESFVGCEDEQLRLTEQLNREAARVDRVLWDFGDAPLEWVSRILRQGMRVLVPLLPTAKCLMQIASTEQWLRRAHRQSHAMHWQYVLNQFDERDPAHMETRRQFRDRLGDRLLPFVLRSSPLVNEALLRGRTIVDHAPASPLVQDLWRLTRSLAGLPRAYPDILPGTWGEH